MTEAAQAIFDPIGDARRQRRILDLIPESDPVFDAAARAAAIEAGLSEEVVELLDRQMPTAPKHR